MVALYLEPLDRRTEATGLTYAPYALRRHRGKITAAALERDDSLPTLYELMEKLSIPRES